MLLYYTLHKTEINAAARNITDMFRRLDEQAEQERGLFKQSTSNTCILRTDSIPLGSPTVGYTRPGAKIRTGTG